MYFLLDLSFVANLKVLLTATQPCSWKVKDYKIANVCVCVCARAVGERLSDIRLQPTRGEKIYHPSGGKDGKICCTKNDSHSAKICFSPISTVEQEGVMTVKMITDFSFLLSMNCFLSLYLARLYGFSFLLIIHAE